MRTLIAAMAAALLLALSIASPAAAFEGGGRKPSEAPLIAWGQHYIGSLSNNKAEANYVPGCSCDDSYQVAVYHLGALNVHDQLVINWHALPFANSSGYPVRLSFVENVDDYTWGSTFGEEEGGPPTFGLSGSGTARSEVTVKNSSTNDYLEFYAEANSTKEFETYPYDFSVEAPRHFLGLALTPKSKIHANGAISGAVTLADGTPAPDGLPFSLSVTWGSNGIANYAATTVGGRVTFPLSLPESAFHQHAVFLVSHGADATYQAVTGRLAANVTPPVASAAEIACEKARQHAQTLSRQYARLKSHARFARGATRRRLHRRASRVGREFRAAQSNAAQKCAGS